MNRLAIILLLVAEFSSIKAHGQETGKYVTDSIKIITGKSIKDESLIGYTTRNEEHISGSIFLIKDEKLLTFPSDNIIKQMQGLVPGLTVVGSGQPGALPKYYIRGFASFSGAAPLIIVDGLPLDDLSALNPNDIESVAVLKDAASAAIYGGRGLNGVIVIKTKKGDRGIHVQYKTFVSWQFPGKGTLDDVLNTKELADLQWLVYRNYNGAPEFHPIYGISTNASPTLPSWAANTDWYEALTNVSLGQNHDLSVSAGTENSKVYLGASYFDQNGIVLNTDTRRYTVRLNSEISFFKKHFTVGENIQIADRSGRYVENAGEMNPILEGPYRTPSIIPVYITEPITGLVKNFLPGEYGGTGIASRLGNSSNVVADRIRNKDDNSNDQLLAGNVYTDLMIFKGLNWRTSFGGTWRKTALTDYRYLTYENSENTLTSSLTAANSELKSWIVTSFLNLDKTFGKHHINALAGVETMKSHFGQYESKTTEGVTETGRILSQSKSNFNPYTLQGVFGNAGYSFDEKYLLDASVRIDDKKVFPAFSLGWCLSNETFMKDIDWLNLLKFRGSYGHTGNMYGNWEHAITSDLGIDSRFFNSHMGISFDWFSRSTKDVYLLIELPGTSGNTPGVPSNDAAMKNTGIDATLNLNKSSGDLKINVDIIFSSYQNEIGYMGYNFFDQASTRIGAIVRNQPGQELYSFYGYKVTGLFSDAADIVKSPVQQGAEPGFFKYADLNGDKVIDPKDKTFLGSPNPDFTAGMKLDMSYKGFDLGFSLYLSEGNEIYNFTKWWTDFWPSFNGQKSKLLLYNSWTESNKNATVPKATYTSNFSTNTQNSSYFVEDGSFLRCRSLHLGYSLNKQFLSKLRISSLRMYVQAVNLFTLTKYSGIDPEIGTYDNVFGIDNGNYPNIRQVIIGLQLEI